MSFRNRSCESDEDEYQESHVTDASARNCSSGSPLHTIMASFNNTFTLLFNHYMSSYSTFAKDLSYEPVEDEDEESHVLDSYVARWELPDSVTHEILLKLPLKSVIRCRRVCRPWYQLVSNPYFTNLYFKKAPLSTIVIRQHQTYTKSGDNDWFCIEIGGDGGVIRKPLNLEAASTSSIMGITKQKTIWMNLIGSCDGLLCLIETPCEEYFYVMSRAIKSSPYMINNAKNAKQVVWIVNPLIGEYIAMPKVHRVNNDANVVYGFGSTVDGNHYKVVRVAMKFSRLQAQILTIGVDKNWRKVENSSSPLRLYSHGVALNGVIHWIGDCGNVNLSHGVTYAFDILKEKGHCFKLPRAVGRMSWQIYLGVWNGHLCITDNSNESQVDVWMMKQYGVVDSWSRDIILKSSIGRHLELIPITTTRNGDLLISCSYTSKLFVFDQKTKKCVKLAHRDTYRTPMLSICYGFNPSFVSPCNVISRPISESEVHKL